MYIKSKKEKKYRAKVWDIKDAQTVLFLSERLTTGQNGDVIVANSYISSGKTAAFVDIDIVPAIDGYLYLLEYTGSFITGKLKSYKTIGEQASVIPRYIYIAASNATDEEKAYATFVCDGIDDAVVLREAVESISDYGGTIELSSGEFVLGSVTRGTDNQMRFVHFKNNAYNTKIVIKGQGPAITGSNEGTSIRVSNSCYESLDDTEYYDVFGASWRGIPSWSRLYVEFDSLTVNLPDNKKKIIVFNFWWVGRPKMNFVFACAHIDGYSELTMPVEGCVGVRMTDGNNMGCVCDFYGCNMSYFYEAWQVAGDHVVMINCSATINVYGYTFGNYPYKGTSAKPITMINCCDERNKNLPLFVKSGTYRNGEYIVASPQLVEMYGFNIEWWNGGMIDALGNRMVVLDDSNFCGIITLKNEGSALKLFESQNNGKNFKVFNAGLSHAGTSSYRQNQNATFHEGDSFFDTTLGKMLWFFNTTWYDANGNIVD